MPKIDEICGSIVELEHEEKREETVTRPVIGVNVITPNSTDRHYHLMNWKILRLVW